MNTPPGQILSCPQTPSTPRHGPKYDSVSPVQRQSARLKRANTASSSSTLTSPPPSSPIAATPSPRRSPRHAKTKKAMFALPPGEDKIVEEEEEEVRTISRPTLLNPSGLGLPTPAKTPRKRKLPEADVASTARALFGSHKITTSVKRDMFGTPRTPSKRNGRIPSAISVEKIETNKSIEIFTDSNARRPTADADPDNPFLVRPGEESRSSKKKRHQIADREANRLGSKAGRTDGMYYTFRGKKLFRPFASLPDKEDRAGSDDEDGLNPASIKPRTLFKSKSPDPEEAENTEPTTPVVANEEVDEEAETDIDEAAASQSSIIISSKKSIRRSVSRMTPESDNEIVPQKIEYTNGLSSAKKRGSRGKRLSGSQALFDDGEDETFMGDLVDKDEIVVKRSTKRKFDFGLDTPPSTSRKRSRRVLDL